MEPVESLADIHYQYQRAIWTSAALRTQSLWGRVDPNNIAASWAVLVPAAVSIVSDAQLAAATDAAGYVNSALMVQGINAEGATLAPSAFSGAASDGRTLAGLLNLPAYNALQGIGLGGTVPRSMAAGRAQLTLMTQTQVADAGRTADGAAIASRDVHVGYVRMLNPPSCSRCALLAGKYYRWNRGFNRHPGCDCRHIPTAENLSDDLRTDPYAYFHSLSPEDQRKHFTEAGAKAINDGADMSQVVNARRGMKYAGESVDGTSRGQKVKGAFTTEGITQRGNFRSATPGGELTNGRRLTPEAIYKLNGDNRAAALVDLEKYGYILPKGQLPEGALRGQREGFGQLGHGGSYEAARQRIYDARINGRNPADRYTMTAAERRLNDAKARWEMVQRGENPYTAPSMTPRAKPMGSPLTPQIAAQVEKDYRRWVASNGEIFR